MVIPRNRLLIRRSARRLIASVPAVVMTLLGSSCGEANVDPIGLAQTPSGECSDGGCDASLACPDGNCVCPESYSWCDGVCAHLPVDSANCGACGVQCLGGSFCAGGVCHCTRGRSYCS